MKIYLYHNISKKPKNEWEIEPAYLQNFIDNLKLKDIPNIEIHFDDAREGVYTYAYPILKPFLSILKATVFVVPNYIDGHVPEHESYSEFMSWEQLKTLSDAGFEIGSHSLNHPDLTSLEEKYLRLELTSSKKILKKKLDLKIINKFSYPYGRYNKQVLDFVRSHYCFAYGLWPANKEYENGYMQVTIPRTVINK